MRFARVHGASFDPMVVWISTLLTLGLVFFVASRVDGTYGSSTEVFWFVVPAASLCLATSFAVLRTAWRDNNGELGIFGLFFVTMSALPLLHGLTLPGPLFEQSTTSDLAGVLALPLAVLAGWPLINPRGMAAQAISTRWKRLALAWVSLLTLGSAFLLTFPRAAPSVDPGSAAVTVISLAAGVAILRMSLGHLRLYRLSGSFGSLIASLGFIVLAASVLGWLPTEPNSAAFWVSHFLDVGGVGLATIAALSTYRQSHDLREIIAPMVSLDPVRALEVGLDPTVHAFVAQLANKDTITRDHVVRVGLLATKLGLRAGMSAKRLPALATAAVLHDVGKLDIDQTVLAKPGRLSADEYELMKAHVVLGAARIEGSPVLAPALPFVLVHHERPDGLGYPAGLKAPDIPLEGRIISVCDAFDAIAHTRQYREGKGPDFALAVLREHAGSQFDPEVVKLLEEELRHTDQLGEPQSFVTIGTRDELSLAPVCADCDHLELVTSAASPGG